MGYRPKQRILNSKISNGQKTLKEMLSFLSHQRNANQYNSEIPSYTCKNGQDKKHWWQLMLERMWRKGTLLHCWWEWNLYSHFGNHYGGYSESWELIYLKTQQYYFCVYTQRMPNHTTRTCSAVFIAAFFVIARTWNNLDVPELNNG